MERRRIVHKIEEGMNPAEVYCTTYQMRNFYGQFADGFFSSLDVMNYIQHHAAVRKMRKGWRVLDVCCGRGLLLPLIRYHKPNIKEYVGVDISQTNMNEQLRRSGIKKIENAEDYYPFKLTHVRCSAEDMGEKLEKESFDLIIYTSSIEHMQKQAGEKSLRNCFSLLKPGREMFLSCPNTSDKKDPYDTQYAAHVYEWSLKDLRTELIKSGFAIKEERGIVGKVRDFEKWMSTRSEEEKEQYLSLKKYLPSAWLMALIPLLHDPEASAEVLLVCSKKAGLLD